MTHVIIQTAEEILDKEFRCLDKGFVRLVDYMGGDESVVQAARVSYGKGTKTNYEDRILIRYLMRHQHTTPFEMVELKFHAKLPLFVARQWIRHRTANVNELSGRYSIMKDEFCVLDLKDVRYQSKINKQGESEDEVPLELGQEFISILIKGQGRSYEEYKYLLEKGIERGLARINLPLSLYTQWYWKIDLHNLLHFLKLRTDKSAQREIRVYAKAMAEITKKIVPLSYEAFEDYVLNSLTFSKLETKIISEIVNKGNLKNELEDITSLLNTVEKGASVIYKGLEFDKLELREFKEKLETLV